jgi:hypothetical protein
MSTANTCPVQFSISEMFYGHTLVKVDFGEKSDEFCVANYLDSDFFDLLDVLFWMNPDLYRECLEPLRTAPRSSFVYNSESKAYRLYWNLEGPDVYLTLRPVGTMPDGDVELKIEDNDSLWIQTVVPYKALCYTVVKAINDLMAKQGLLGMCWTNESKDLNLRHFLHLKAFALDLGPIDDCDGFTSYSKLEDDLKLVALPMG